MPKIVVVGDFMIVLAIDPGRDKCGVAVMDQNNLYVQKVLPRSEYLTFVVKEVERHKIDLIILGDGTGSSDFLREIGDKLPRIVIKVVDEKYSTEEARKRYWQDHKPVGLRKFMPVSMQVPPVPYDDYVAVILGERFLANGD